MIHQFCSSFASSSLSIKCINKLPTLTDPKSRCIETRQSPLPEGLVEPITSFSMFSYDNWSLLVHRHGRFRLPIMELFLCKFFRRRALLLLAFPTCCLNNDPRAIGHARPI